VSRDYSYYFHIVYIGNSISINISFFAKHKTIKEVDFLKRLRNITIYFLVFLCSAKPVLAGNWGLSYQKEGATPVGSENKEFLQQYSSYFVGNEEEKVIYLTFDAGYENNYTDPILDVLENHGVPAAFFLVGTYIRENPELITRMVQGGHIVGNHTMKHPDIGKISTKEAFLKEVKGVEAEYEKITGQQMPKYYRPPKGQYNENTLKIAHELGYKTVFWSLAYVDWHDDKQPSKEEAFSKLIPRIHPGAIILLHNTSKTNANILDELIVRYKEMGYTFGSLDDIG